MSMEFVVNAPLVKIGAQGATPMKPKMASPRATMTPKVKLGSFTNSHISCNQQISKIRYGTAKQKNPILNSIDFDSWSSRSTSNLDMYSSGPSRPRTGKPQVRQSIGAQSTKSLKDLYYKNMGPVLGSRNAKGPAKKKRGDSPVGLESKRKSFIGTAESMSTRRKTSCTESDLYNFLRGSSPLKSRQSVASNKSDKMKFKSAEKKAGRRSRANRNAAKSIAQTFQDYVDTDTIGEDLVGESEIGMLLNQDTDQTPKEFLNKLRVRDVLIPNHCGSNIAADNQRVIDEMEQLIADIQARREEGLGQDFYTALDDFTYDTRRKQAQNPVLWTDGKGKIRRAESRTKRLIVFKNNAEEHRKQIDAYCLAGSNDRVYMANPNKSYVVRNNPDQQINYKSAFKRDKTKFLTQKAFEKPIYTHVIKSKHVGTSGAESSDGFSDTCTDVFQFKRKSAPRPSYSLSSKLQNMIQDKKRERSQGRMSVGNFNSDRDNSPAAFTRQRNCATPDIFLPQQQSPKYSDNSDADEEACAIAWPSMANK